MVNARLGILCATVATWVLMPAEGEVADIDLSSLTVPVAALGDACRLGPPPTPGAPVVDVGNMLVVRRSLPFSLVADNPWTGSDRAVLTELRKTIDGGYPTATTDGPPLSAAERAQLDEHYGAPVEAGYQALYEVEGRVVVSVRAIRFGDAAFARSSAGMTPRPGRLLKGATAARIIGDSSSDCFRIVDAHVRERLR